MRRRRALGLAAAAMLAIAPAIAEAGKGDSKPINGPTVKVADDFFAPDEIKIKSNTKVKFKWSADNGNQHNVTLTKGPKKVKKKDFTSGTGAIGIKFKPVFEKRGTYDFYCTLHPGTMKLKVTVKK